MCALEKYYEEKLYPLQNGVLNIVSSANTPFFLTGGTALSRYYTHHRYSDDLDFFVVRNAEYSSLINKVLDHFLSAESQGQFKIDHASIFKSEDYTHLDVSSSDSDEVILKVEFVNDIAQHYGEIIVDAQLGRIDSLRNILSNKLTALFRSEPKDIADIYAIALQEEIDWHEIVVEAKTKEAGADPEVLYDILLSFPLEQLSRVKWVAPPASEEFKKVIETVAEDVLFGRRNSLYSS